MWMLYDYLAPAEIKNRHLVSRLVLSFQTSGGTDSAHQQSSQNNQSKIEKLKNPGHSQALLYKALPRIF